jgi:phthiocerol/phenolphthiocerol synthesis type-I polyketide synthase A
MTAEADAHADLRNWLVDYLVTTIGCSPEDIKLDVPLHELGVGSRDAVVLAGELSELLDRTVSPVDFWQNPTIDALAHGLLNPDADFTSGGEQAVGSLHEPIAVIGLGCRLPGDNGDVRGPDGFWQFLADGRSAVGEVPAGRWQMFDDGTAETRAVLARTTKWGSFLEGVAAFDGEYFDISPSEADRIDPQQRLLLEVAVEALDHAGIPVETLQRTQTGVFAGACVSEYGFLASQDLARVDAWTGTGGALSIIANRLSYFLDARGPSVTIDTACSSSLVAIHLASRSLRLGESDLALAAGVNLVLAPTITRSFDTAEAMSRSGACRAFDAGADGFVRGEGCGVVVLKRLSEAVRDGNRILAVVRGSAMNQDGRSNGLMAPNPAAQTAVLRAACADAGIEPLEVDYVEAHGTGTLLGDPIEARGLGSVYGRGRAPDAPLLIGSVKSNVGHLEAAAGVVGFIKATLALQRGWIPGNLHFDAPNPHIPFGELRLKVVDEATNWPATGRPRRAGVSSFGFGGTNAHLVLEGPPAPAATPLRVADAPVITLVVSGKTTRRVANWAEALADWVDGPGAMVPLADIAHTVNHHRARHGVFATVAARTRDEAVAGLRALAAGQSAIGVVGPHQGSCGSGTVFVYSGQGSQWAGMGRKLLADEPAFAAAVDELELEFVAELGFSLRDVLANGEPVEGSVRVQSVIFGMQMALTALWRSYGIQPDAVMGHSMGEVTAAVVACALTPAEGLRVIAARSRLMAGLADKGAVALLELDAAAAEALIAAFPGVTVSVYSSPRQTVVAGPTDAVVAVIAAAQARDVFARRVNMEVASHTAMMDPILPELRAQLADLVPGFATIPVIPTTAGREDMPTFDADHWCDNLRNQVRFTQAVAEAADQHSVFIEISPHPVLTHAIDDTVGEQHHHSIGTLQRDADDTVTFHTNLNAAHTKYPPQTVHLPEPHPQLPSMPWVHTDHWFPTDPKPLASGGPPRPGTLLGEHIVVSSSPPAQLWQARVSSEVKPYPGQHRLHGVELAPASVLCQTVLAAAAETGAGAVHDIAFLQPLPMDQPRFVQVVSDGGTVTVSSGADATGKRWVRHVSATVTPAGPVPAHLPSSGVNHAAAPPFSVTDYLTERGVDGPPFEWSVQSLTATADGVAVDVELAVPSTVALLDAALHLGALAGSAEGLLIPATAELVQVVGEPADAHAVLDVRSVPGHPGEIVVDIVAAAADGTPHLLIRGLRYAALDAAPARVNSDPTRLAHRISWLPRNAESLNQQPLTGTVAVIGPDAEANAHVRRLLGEHGLQPTTGDDAGFVLYLADSRQGADLDAAVELSAEVTAVVNTLTARHDQRPATLWVITRGVLESADPAALPQSALWGLANVVAAEQPQIWGGLVDLEIDARPEHWVPIVAANLSTPSKSALVLRGGQVLAPELVALDGPEVRPALRCRQDAAYLVTGGLGALGLATANWLADLGARRLVLAGRTMLPARRLWDSVADPATAHRIAGIRALEARGVAVEPAALDVAAPGALAEFLEHRDAAGASPIRGVVHAAGVTDNRLLTDVDEQSLRTVMAPKIAGAAALHEAFPPEDVDFFFMTASAATIFGVPGQGSYAAGNAYLDALARSRQHAGGLTQSIDWAAWRGLGFGADAALVLAELDRLGSRPVESDEAFAAWAHIATLDVAQAVVIPMVGDDGPVAEPHSGPGRDWSGLTADEVYREVSDGLRAALARELRIAEPDLPVDRPFIELGLNSLMAMSIRREAEQLVGMELSVTMLWNHPTVSALSTFLTDKIAPQRGSDSLLDDPLTVADAGIGVLDDLFDSVEAGGLSGGDTL